MEAPRFVPLVLFLPGFILPGADPIAAQTAREILAQAMERHEDRLADVEDLLVRQQVMGLATTAYLVKEVVDGRPVLRASPEVGAAPVNLGGGLADLWIDPGTFYTEWADRWALEGASVAGGGAGWRMRLTDFDGLDWEGGALGGSFQPRSVTLKLDRDELVPLEMIIEGEIVDGVEPRTVSLVARFDDYREVSGYLHPFLSTVEMDLSTAGLSQEEVAQAREALEELRRQLDQTPQGRRERMEEVMDEQIRMLEAIVFGGRVEVEIRVTELRVNAGPP